VDYRALRSTAAEFIRGHRHDFEPFLFADEYSSAKDIESYCKEIEQTALWGGEMELTALSRAMGVTVEIYSNRSKTPLVIEPPDRSRDGETVRLAYYQHLYGLGQHYNGLFKI
jgi:OTU domain-containing protein 6